MAPRTRIIQKDGTWLRWSVSVLSVRSVRSVVNKENIMQTTMAVEDIKLTLPELLDSLTPGMK